VYPNTIPVQINFTWPHIPKMTPNAGDIVILVVNFKVSNLNEFTFDILWTFVIMDITDYIIK